MHPNYKYNAGRLHSRTRHALHHDAIVLVLLLRARLFSTVWSMTYQPDIASVAVPRFEAGDNGPWVPWHLIRHHGWGSLPLVVPLRCRLSGAGRLPDIPPVKALDTAGISQCGSVQSSVGCRDVAGVVGLRIRTHPLEGPLLWHPKSLPGIYPQRNQPMYGRLVVVALYAHSGLSTKVSNKRCTLLLAVLDGRGEE